MTLKRIKMPGPVFPEGGEPGVDFEQRLRSEAVDSALGVDRGFDEPGVLQDPQML